MNDNNTRTSLGWIITGLALFATLGSGIEKLAGAPYIIEGLGQFGMADKAILLGVLQFLFVSIYMIPRTMHIGFFLLCAYWGGAFAVSMSHGWINPMPIIVLLLLSIGSFVRKPALLGLTD